MPGHTVVTKERTENSVHTLYAQNRQNPESSDSYWRAWEAAYDCCWNMLISIFMMSTKTCQKAGVYHVAAYAPDPVKNVGAT